VIEVFNDLRYIANVNSFGEQDNLKQLLFQV